MLRKKLESSGGVPPRVLQNKPFWTTLEHTVSTWLNGVLQDEGDLRLQSREVSPGAALADDLFGAYVYGFRNEDRDFVVAVSIDNLVAARFAAQKMQQDASRLAEAPQLFLQLLLEPPASELSAALAATFDMLGEDGEPPQAAAFETLEVEGNCLIVYYLCDLEGQAFRIGVALKLDAVLAIANSAGDDSPGGGAVTGDAKSFSQPRVQNSSVQLDVVLDRLPMTVADCLRLEEGSVISLPGTHRSKLTITANTVEGPVDIAEGELGVWKHQRAVRLKSPIDPAFLREVATT
nr:FliM/FliN family flagellar motor C-terminal domain-containing protein [Hyphomonas sp. Mor2]